MLKKVLLAGALLGGLSVSTLLFGGFNSASSSAPCACCGEACTCGDVCVCDENGCACGDTGGDCACSEDCCKTCCGD